MGVSGINSAIRCSLSVVPGPSAGSVPQRRGFAQITRFGGADNPFQTTSAPRTTRLQLCHPDVVLNRLNIDRRVDVQLIRMLYLVTQASRSCGAWAVALRDAVE